MGEYGKYKAKKRVRRDKGDICGELHGGIGICTNIGSNTAYQYHNIHESIHVQHAFDMVTKQQCTTHDKNLHKNSF